MPDDIGSAPQADAATAASPAPPAPKADGEAAAKRKRLFLILAAVVIAGAVIWGLYYLLIGSKHVSTDNAYVNADVAQDRKSVV